MDDFGNRGRKSDERVKMIKAIVTIVDDDGVFLVSIPTRVPLAIDPSLYYAAAFVS